MLHYFVCVANQFVKHVALLRYCFHFDPKSSFKQKVYLNVVYIFISTRNILEMCHLPHATKYLTLTMIDLGFATF